MTFTGSHRTYGYAGAPAVDGGRGVLCLQEAASASQVGTTTWAVITRSGDGAVA